MFRATVAMIGVTQVKIFFIWLFWLNAILDTSVPIPVNRVSTVHHFKVYFNACLFTGKVLKNSKGT